METDREPVEVRTDDGYVFRKQADGSWTDGQITFQSLEDLEQQYHEYYTITKYAEQEANSAR